MKLLLFRHQVVSDSLWPLGLQHARLPCPSPTPGGPKLMFIESVMPSNYLIFCRPFSSCPQSFPASNCFPMSQLFVSGGQSTIQGWFPLGSTSLSSLSLQGTLQSLLQHHNWKTSIFQRSAYYIVQLSHPYTTTGKTIILTRWTFVSKVMNLLSNIRLGLS